MNIVLWYPSMFTVEFKITRYVLTRLSKAGVAIAASDRTVLDPANACFKVKEKLLYFPWHQMHRVWLEKSMNFWQASSCHKLWGNLGLWRSMPWCIRSCSMIGTIKANQVVCKRIGPVLERESLSYLVWVKNSQDILVEKSTRNCSDSDLLDTAPVVSLLGSTWYPSEPQCLMVLPAPLTVFDAWQVISTGKFGASEARSIAAHVSIAKCLIDLDTVALLFWTDRFLKSSW